jgi:hypothetical protein
MLCVNAYPREYVEKCRASIDRQVAAFQELLDAAAGPDGTVTQEFAAARAQFEPVFFNSLVHVLDGCFTHRSRTIEGKDGNAMNEVRLLCASLLTDDGKLVADKQIKLKADKSVLGYAVGDTVRLTQDDFMRLAKAFFDAIETTFV